MQTVLADLSDADLVSHVRQLLTAGAKLEVETLIALNVMHERKLYEPKGFGSFHVYCVNVLRMSDDTAARRSKVGRLLRLYPVLVRELIETQAASVTALAKLEPVITDENAERLLNEVRGKTVREVELVVVREVPKPAVQSGFRTVFVPALTLNAEQAPKSVDSNAVRHDEAPGVTSEEEIRIDAVSAPANTAPPRSKKRSIEPRAVDHYAFSANMNEVTKTKLKEAMDVGNFESYDALFAAAVEALRTELLKKKYAQVAKPRKKRPATATETPATRPPATRTPATRAPATRTPATRTPATRTPATRTPATRTPATRTPATRTPATRTPATRTPATRTPATRTPATRTPATRAPTTRAPTTRAPTPRTPATRAPTTEDPLASHARKAISASVRREVYLRDSGRCTFEGTEGRCTETRFIEFHHRITVADGGPATAENITLHCHAHNIHQAELDFGAAHMRQFENSR